MRLNSLNFEHHLETNSFIKFMYGIAFPIENVPAAKKEILTCFGQLEQILDAELANEAVDKREVGKVTANEMSKGVVYKLIGLANIGKMHINLAYSAIMQGNQITGLEVSLYHDEEDSNRLVKVYDRIVQLPGLELSDIAKSNMEKIRLLRSLGSAGLAYQLLLSGNEN